MFHPASINFHLLARLFISSVFVFAFTIHGEDISFHLPVDSSGVGKILTYNLNQTVQNDIEFVNRKINDRVFLETHLGCAYYKELKFSSILGIKFNILNPKLPYYPIIKAKVFKIRRLSAALNGGLDSASSNKLFEIESLLAKYDKDKWKRFSISVTAPVSVMMYDTSFYVDNNGSAHILHISSYFSPKILRIFGFSVGYDLADIATVNVGTTFISPFQIYGSITFDVSTPTYLALGSFLNQVVALLYPNLRGAPNIEYN
jgi:hypothetical protein